MNTLKNIALYLCSTIGLTAQAETTEKNSQHDNSPSVIVVGAGIAGLSAAKHLHKNNISVTVLEAQNSIGGRLKTDRSLGVPFDEGASWIHGPDNNPITSLAEQSGAKTYLTDDDSVMVFDKQGKPYTDTQLEKTEKQFNKTLRRLYLKQSLSKKTGKSFGEFFYENYPQHKDNDLWTYMLSAFLEFDLGGDIHQLSANPFGGEVFDGEDIIITNGYDHVTNHLAKDLDIKLNTTVTAIDYSADKVTVKTSAGDYIANKVIITVPLGVLKKQLITFTPALPAPLSSAIDNLAMGSVNKYLLVWDKPFWDTSLQYVGFTPAIRGKFNYFLNVKTFSSANALMTFTFGEYSKAAEKMSDEAIIKTIMEHLTILYGKEIPAPIAMRRTRWNQNPYTLGAYSFAGKYATDADFEIFEENLDNKVFFAGEHTSVDYRGTVHGAYLSGLREAKKIHQHHP